MKCYFCHQYRESTSVDCKLCALKYNVERVSSSYDFVHIFTKKYHIRFNLNSEYTDATIINGMIDIEELNSPKQILPSLSIKDYDGNLANLLKRINNLMIFS